MHEGKMIFSQVMALLPWRRFQTCVDRYRGDDKVISLHTHELFKIMLFAQLAGRESLSSTVLCLNVFSSYCYHIGIRSKSTKSNLAHANNKRNWKIFYDFAQILIKETTKLYRNDSIKLDINEGVYALDSTTIDLCLTLFPWAHFRKTKSAIKMHTKINLRGKIPARNGVAKNNADPYFYGENTRCQCNGSYRLGTGMLVCHGSWLPRL